MRFCLECCTRLTDEILGCSACAAPYDSEKAERLLDFADFIMVASRHSIPAYSGEDFDKDSLYHTPDLSEMARWIALAAVGGVIGNLTTDAVKAIVNRIRLSVAVKGDASSGGDDLPEEAEILVEQAIAFFRVFPSLSAEVKSAVISELQVHLLQRKLNIRDRIRQRRATPNSQASLPLEGIDQAVRSVSDKTTDLLANPPVDELKRLWARFVREGLEQSGNGLPPGDA